MLPKHHEGHSVFPSFRLSVRQIGAAGLEPATSCSRSRPMECTLHAYRAQPARNTGGIPNSVEQDAHRNTGWNTGCTRYFRPGFRPAHIGFIVFMPGAEFEPARGCPQGILSPLVGVVRQRSALLCRHNKLPNTPINPRLCTHRGGDFRHVTKVRSAPKYGWVRLSTGTCRGQGPLPFGEIIPLPSTKWQPHVDEVRSKGDVNGGR